MASSAQLLDRLRAIEAQAWTGVAYRHMFADYSPERENIGGARWNPSGVAAIYASLSAEGALAEAEYQIAMQPVRPRARRTLYELHVTLASVLDLSDRALLAELGVGAEQLGSLDLDPCQSVGGAAEWLKHDGILVPSARAKATNLVILAANAPASPPFEIVSRQEVSE